jgi:hypothetical protein
MHGVSLLVLGLQRRTYLEEVMEKVIFDKTPAFIIYEKNGSDLWFLKTL